MSSIYNGYVYIWHDTKAKFFYVGGHYGLVEDSYICSSKMMLRAYKKRPDTFRFRVLEYVIGDTRTLREAEQRWLNMIKDSELYWTPNIYANTTKYYNQKKHSAGGNGKANKGVKQNLSAEERARRKATVISPETRTRMNEGHAKRRGIKRGPMTEEQKKKLSIAHTGKIQGPHSKSHSQKISDSVRLSHIKKRTSVAFV